MVIADQYTFKFSFRSGRFPAFKDRRRGKNTCAKYNIVDSKVQVLRNSTCGKLERKITQHTEMGFPNNIY